MTNQTKQHQAFKKYARFSGAFKVAVGSIFSFFVLRSLLNGANASGGFQLILLAMPMAFVLIGLLEFFSGYPFLKFSQAWGELKGWQRGVLGALVIVFLCVMIMVGVV